MLTDVWGLGNGFKPGNTDSCEQLTHMIQISSVSDTDDPLVQLYFDQQRNFARSCSITSFIDVTCIFD